MFSALNVIIVLFIFFSISRSDVPEESNVGDFLNLHESGTKKMYKNFVKNGFKALILHVL